MSTERPEAERVVERPGKTPESRAILAAIDNLADPVVVVDDNHRPVHLNPAATALAGLSPDGEPAPDLALPGLDASRNRPP